MRLGDFRAAWAGAGFALAACAPSVTASRGHIATSSRSITPSRAAPEDTPWTTAPLPSIARDESQLYSFDFILDEPLPADATGDDTDSFVVGSMRVQARGDRIAWAHQNTFGPIIAQAHEGDRWVFVTREGAVLRSTGFLGDLETVPHSVVEYVNDSRDSIERITLIDGQRAFETIDTEGRALTLARPAGRSFVDAAFVSRTVGYAIAEPGVLLRTSDGGSRFDPVALEPEFGAAYRLVLHGHTLRVDGTGGSFDLATDGLTTRVDGNARVWSRAAVAQTTRIAEDWLAHDPLARPTLIASHHGVALADGSVAALHRGTLVSVHADGTVRHDSLRYGSFVGARGACRVGVLTGRIAAACDQDGSTVIHMLARNGAWREVRTLRPARRVIFENHDDGVIVVSGRCEDSATVDDRATCWSDGDHWISRALPEAETWVRASGSNLLLFHWDNEETTNPVHVVSALARNAAAVPLKFTPRDVRVEFADPVAGGNVMILARDRDQLLAGVGPALETIELAAVPNGALTARFADARHGIAVANNLQQAWTTVDGGRSWTPLEVPIDGDLHSYEIVDPDEPDEADVRCWSTGCHVGHRYVWGPGLPNVPRAAGGRSAPSRVFGPASQWFIPFRTSLMCSSRGDARGHFVPATESESAVRGYGADVWADLESSRSTGAGDLAGRIHWRSYDPRGGIDATSGESVVPGHVSTGTLGPTLLAPLVATRTRLVAARCFAMDTDDYACPELVIARPGRPAVVVDVGEFVDSRHDSPFAAIPRGVSVERDGSLLVHIGFETRFSPARDAIVRVDTGDRFHVVRSFAWDVHRPQRVLARWGDRVGLAVFRRAVNDRIEFFPATGDPSPMEHPWVSDGTRRPCSPADRGVDANRLELTTDNSGLDVLIRSAPRTRPFGGVATSRLAIRGDGTACVREVTWSALGGDENQASAPRVVHAVAGTDDAMNGLMITSDGLHDAHCEPAE